MSNLADQIAEIRETTAALLERTEPAPPPEPEVADNFVRIGSVAPVAALLAMRAMLNIVPPAYWQIGPTRLTIACACRRAYRVPNTVVDVECKCGRIFLWSSRSLYALKPEYVNPTDPKEGS